ncbi:MAG: thiamine phosphate synthase, partial [Fibrobacteres bacterium]|nr:thiamine phosphate synthase [Fibrobacterota bacterium]
DPVLGINGMSEMIGLSTVPAVAIGAVDESNLRDVLRGGAKNFASVRPINKTDKPEAALKRLLAIWKDETVL